MKRLGVIFALLLGACKGSPSTGPSTPPSAFHPPCAIAEQIGGRTQPPYAFITECGILFYADYPYAIGDSIELIDVPLNHK